MLMALATLGEGEFCLEWELCGALADDGCGSDCVGDVDGDIGWGCAEDDDGNGDGLLCSEFLRVRAGESAKLSLRGNSGDGTSRATSEVRCFLPGASKSKSDDSSIESANFRFRSVSIARLAMASPVPRDTGGGDATVSASVESESAESGGDGFCLRVFFGGSSRDSAVSQNCFRMPRSCGVK